MEPVNLRHSTKKILMSPSKEYLKCLADYGSKNRRLNNLDCVNFLLVSSETY